MIPLSPTSILSGVFLLTLLSFALFTVVLFWHWKQFSTGTFTTVFSMLVYLAVSGVLFMLMGSSLFLF